MPDMNIVMLMGNLVQDAEVRRLPRGGMVAKMRLAIDEVFKDAEGERKKRTVYVDVEAWDRLAEDAEGRLRKGMPVFVEGRLHTDSWETQEGQKRSRLLVRAHKLESIDRNPTANTKPTGKTQPPPSPELSDPDVPF